MIQKPSVWLIGLITCFLAVVSPAEPSNVVTKADVAVTNANVVTNPNAGGHITGRLGDPALPLTVAQWIKGKPVKIQPGTNIYVLVFCTLSMANEVALTNLSSLQRQFRDKGLIAVAISDEPPQTLKEFVRLKDAEIDFTVAADGLAGQTAGNYQLVFNQYILPQAYVVGRDGKVLWYGHPLVDGLNSVVEEIISGRYNLEQTEKKIRAREQLNQYRVLARQQHPKLQRAGQMLLRIRTNDAPGLCELAYLIATDPGIEDTKRDAALANAALDRAQQITTTNATDVMVIRAIVTFQVGQTEQGLALARKAQAIAQTDAEKQEAEGCVQTMEAHLAEAKTGATDGTNSVGNVTAPANKP